MKKKKYITAAAAVIGAAAVVCALYFGSRRLEFTAGGQKITEEIYIQTMNSQIADVTSYFAQKGADRVNGDFWETEVDGEVPYEALADRTMERIRYLAAAYDMAEEYSGMEAGALTCIQERLEKENASRKERNEAGEPVYGLLEFSMDTFLEYDLDRIQKKYCENAENPGMEITSEEQEAYYEDNKDVLYRKNDDVTLEYIKLDCSGMIEEEKDGCKSQLIEIYKSVDAKTTLSAAAKKFPRFNGLVETADVASGEMGAYSRSIGDVLEYSAELKAGESTPVLDENGTLYLIQCTARTENDYQTLAEVRDSISKTLREERYEQLVRERAEQTAVSADMEQIYSFTKKSVA